jgi:hypothetical protein
MSAIEVMLMPYRSNAWGLAILPIGLLIACKPTNAISPAPTPSTPPTTIAQATPATVVDYFLAAPEQYFKVLDRDQVPASVRRKLLQQSNAVVDATNGYISTSSIAPDLCNYEMAIFRRTGGSYLVALNVGCTVRDTLTIFDPDRDWANVTAEVFPVSVLQSQEMGLMIKLPRYGRTIEVLDENNKSLAKVEFNGKKFETR